MTGRECGINGEDEEDYSPVKTLLITVFIPGSALAGWKLCKCLTSQLTTSSRIPRCGIYSSCMRRIDVTGMKVVHLALPCHDSPFVQAKLELE